MLKASVKYYLIPVGVFCATVLVDVVTKRLVAFSFGSRQLVGSFLILGNFSNSRGLFGFMSLAFAVATSFVVFLFIFYLFFQTDSLNERMSLAFVLGGGVSNFCERLISGQVTDIFAVGNLGVMNIADLAIFFGAVWYAYLLFKKYY